MEVNVVRVIKTQPDWTSDLEWCTNLVDIITEYHGMGYRYVVAAFGDCFFLADEDIKDELSDEEWENIAIAYTEDGPNPEFNPQDPRYKIIIRNDI